ncbi:MAG: hypothetical protein IGQ45_11010 [Cyanobacterium sp. T60_A2020_053]|nr:hypothetical protein [Cyanobacterium sp. T60_A2020_053]
MFSFRPKFPKKESIPVTLKPPPQRPIKPVRIPRHFLKNSIITYSQRDIQREIKKYPGLLKTLSHAYQYQIIMTGENEQKEYWFCRDLGSTMPLLKYLNEQNWQVDWQEKPFIL